jgi:hypothetical protein
MRNTALSYTTRQLQRIYSNQAVGAIVPRRMDIASHKQEMKFNELGDPKAAIVKGIYASYNLDISGTPVADKLAMWRPSFNGDIELRFKDGTKIVDKGPVINITSPSTIPAEERAFVVVSMAKAKGWKGMSTSGADDYVMAVWAECLRQGIKISLKPEQRALYEMFMGIQQAKATEQDDQRYEENSSPKSLKY